jgi:hypothetical protein
MSYDLPLWSIVETSATLYQKDQERFHLLMTEPLVQDFQPDGEAEELPLSPPTPRLIWVEMSPYRVIMTMQGNGQFSYRHFWEQGIYGVSRYWLQTSNSSGNQQIRLRNFTRSLTLEKGVLPQHLRIEYELWTSQLQIGQYVLNLEIVP